MTSPGSAQSQHKVILHCLEAASRFVPSSQSPAPALESLREIVSSMPSTAESSDGPPAKAQQTLELVLSASQLLSHLDESSNANPLGWETVSAITRILDDLTVQLGSTVRKEKADLVRGLYVIIDPRVTGGREPMAIAQAPIRGGARMLQLRDKLRDKGESLALAFDLQKICAESGVSLIVNDHVDIAAIVGSAGVHVGQTDIPVDRARQVLAPHQVLGRSNRDIDQLIESEQMGADHVAFGAVYETNTTGKGLGRPPRGVEQLRIARDNAQTPLVAIGGINAENAAAVVEAGADALCLTAAVASAPEPEAAAELVKIIEEAGGRI